MNIAVFIKRTTFHKDYGGLATQNKELCEGLVEQGHYVTVFSPSWEIAKDKVEEKGVKYYFVSCEYRMGKFLGFGGAGDKDNWVNRSFEEFVRLHNSRKYDLVLGQSSAALGIIIRKRDLGIPVISVAHGSIIGEYRTFVDSLNWKNPQNWWKFVKNTGFTLKNFFDRQRKFVHGSDMVITVSRFVKKALIDETFAPEEKFTVIYNGVNPAPFAKSTGKKLRGGDHLLYVGRIEKEKGLDSLIEILRDPRFNDVNIIAVGGGPYSEELRNKIDRNSLNEKFHLMGRQEFTEVLKYYKSPDVVFFVFPTERVEGFPMVLVEAMLSGLPVVAFDMGGVSDAVIDKETGFVVDAGDIEKYAELCLKLWGDEGLRREMGQRAREVALKNFTTNVMIEQYLKQFTKVINKYENS